MFGIEIIDAALLPAMTVALLAGVLSFLSPCVLPIVPPYLAYMGGISMGEMTATGQARRRVILPALFFVMGLSTIFLLLGFTASAFGSFVLQNQLLLARISGIIIIIFGLHLWASSALAFWTGKCGWMRATGVGRRWGPMCWGWLSPLAGRPASARSWARS